MNVKTSIILALALVLPARAARGAEISVGIEEIPAMAAASSPYALLIEGDLSLARAQRDLDLRWSNPSLAWEMEEVTGGGFTSREWIVAIEKEFAMPWSYAKKRSSTDLRLESARLGGEAARWRLISRLRRGYVRLQQHDREAKILESIEEIVEEASRVAAERKDQGAISGIEMRLIDMSLLSVRTRMVETRVARRDLMGEWKTAMGIPAEDSVILVSAFDPVAGGIPRDGAPDDATSETASRRLVAEALKEQIGVEKSDLFPSMSLVGGYKNVDSEASGFVVGVSIPIPLLNRNSGGVDRASAEHRKARAELDLYEMSRKRRIALLLDAASEEASVLDRYHGDMALIEGHISDLAAAYTEGWFDLGDFLEGIRTYTDSIEQYFDMLKEYHDIVFELEELTERELYAPGAAGAEENGS